MELDDRQEEELYDYLAKYGPEYAARLFGKRHDIPCIIVEAHLLRIKHLISMTGLEPVLPKLAYEASEEQLEREIARSDRKLDTLRQKSKKQAYKTGKRKGHDLVDRWKLVEFAKLYLKDGDAGCDWRVFTRFNRILQKWLIHIIALIRLVAREKARGSLRDPNKMLHVDHELVYATLGMNGGNPLKVSGDAAAALEQLPFSGNSRGSSVSQHQQQMSPDVSLVDWAGADPAPEDDQSFI